MSRIFKFDLGPAENDFHGIVRVLGVGWQGGNLRVWAEVDPDDRTTLTTLYAAVTGQEPPPDGEFIGTAVGPEFVIHVYRVR